VARGGNSLVDGIGREDCGGVKRDCIKNVTREGPSKGDRPPPHPGEEGQATKKQEAAGVVQVRGGQLHQEGYYFGGRRETTKERRRPT